jgi:hypothetical protein
MIATIQQQNAMAIETLIAIAIAALYLIISRRWGKELTWPVWLVFALLMIALAITGGGSGA